jgi:hypothetical protein
VESGALTGHDAEVLATLPERLDAWFDGDDPMELTSHVVPNS